jgi:hypothetical protein
MSVQILGRSRGQRLPDFREDRVLKMPFGAGIPSRDYNKDLKTFLEVPWLIGAITRLSSESSKRKVGQDRPWVIRLDSDERQLTLRGSSCVSTLTARSSFPKETFYLSGTF